MSLTTRANGKGGREKFIKSTQNGKQNLTEHSQHKANDNSKPQATAEQIRIAQLINEKHTDADPEIQAKVSQVMELTHRTSDEAAVALHDCDNDVAKAVNMLLEGAQDQGEWELSGKKKKSRQNANVSKQNNTENIKNGNQSNANNKENKNNKHERNHDNKDRENSRSRGPRLNKGKGWRGRENEKNQKNLEEDTSRRTNSFRGGRGGRGRGRGGSRSRTFENKSATRDGFPNSIDTWTNSTAEQADPNTGNDATMTVGNWADFKATEDWSDEIDDWNENLNETKVFTPSAPASSSSVPNNGTNISNGPSESINLTSFLQKSAGGNVEGSAILNQTGQSPFLGQYQQKATDSIKSVVGSNTNSTNVPIQNAQASNAYSVGQSMNYRTGSQNLNSQNQKYQSAVSQQQQRMTVSSQSQLSSRTKPQRTRLPPPSKIPASAVEMPDDALGSIDVQFSGLEFGTESTNFDISSNSDATSHYNVTGSSAPLSNHLTSSAAQSLLSNSSDAYNAASVDSTGGSSMSSSTRPMPHISQSGLSQSQKLNSASESMMMPSQSDGSAYNSSLSSAIDVGNMGTSKQDSSNLGEFSTSTASVLHQNNSLPYQSTYKSSSLSSSNTSSNYSSLPSTQKSYNQTNNSSYAQSSSISSFSDQSAYSVSDPTSTYQSQYQTSGFQPVSSFQGSNVTYSSNPASSYGSSTKIAGSLSSEAPSLNQNSQSSFENSVSSTVDSLNTGSSTLSSAVTTSSSSSASSINVTALGLNSNVSTVTTSVATNSAALKTSLTSGKSMPNLPPGVPMIGPHQFIMSNTGVPFYAFQQPSAAAGFGVEEMQMLQSRLPHPAGYYDVPFQSATSMTTGRDGSLNSIPYSATDGKFNRGDSNSSPIPTSLSQQSSSQHQFMNPTAAAALPPGYTSYYYLGMPSFPQQYSHVYPAVQPTTNAHGATTNTQFQKPGAYGSHTYSSASGVSVGSSAGTDMNASVYNKTHSQLSKSQFDKPGFHAGTPPPYNLSSGVTAGAGHQTAGGPMGTAPSGHFPTPAAQYLPMMAQHHLPAMLHSLQPDVSSGSSQRSGQSSSQQKGGSGNSAKAFSSNNYWNSS